MAGDRKRRFDRWWENYPRKVAKAEAERAWSQIDPDELLAKQLCEAVWRQRKSEQWRRDQGQYIPHPATWLRQRRWEDQVSVSGAAPPDVDPIEARVVWHDS